MDQIQVDIVQTEAAEAFIQRHQCTFEPLVLIPHFCCYEQICSVDVCGSDSRRENLGCNPPSTNIFHRWRACSSIG